MKKKLLTAALSMVLCLGMSVTAMAAPSPNGGASVNRPTEGTGTVSVGSLGTIDKSGLNEADKAAVEAIDAELEAAFKDVDWSKYNQQEAAEINNKVYVAMFEKRGITFTTVNAITPLVLTGDAVGWKRIPGVSTVGMTGHPYLVHVKDGVMEYLPTTAAGTEIWAQFNGKFSPFYLVDGEMPVVASETPAHYHNFGTLVVEPTATTWGYTTYYCSCGYEYHDNYVAPTNGAATAATSPKTADSALPFVMAVAAVAAIGGAVVVSRRKYTA